METSDVIAITFGICTTLAAFLSVILALIQIVFAYKCHPYARKTKIIFLGSNDL